MFLRGHGIPCKFCGCQSAEHELGEKEVESPGIVRRGYRLSFLKCPGYKPKSQKEWQKAERTFQEQEVRRSEASGHKRAFPFGTFTLRN